MKPSKKRKLRLSKTAARLLRCCLADEKSVTAPLSKSSCCNDTTAAPDASPCNRPAANPRNNATVKTAAPDASPRNRPAAKLHNNATVKTVISDASPCNRPAANPVPNVLQQFRLSRPRCRSDSVTANTTQTGGSAAKNAASRHINVRPGPMRHRRGVPGYKKTAHKTRPPAEDFKNLAQ